MAHTFIGDWQPGCIGIGQGPAYSHFVGGVNAFIHRSGPDLVLCQAKSPPSGTDLYLPATIMMPSVLFEISDLIH